MVDCSRVVLSHAHGGHREEHARRGEHDPRVASASQQAQHQIVGRRNREQKQSQNRGHDTKRDDTHLFGEEQGPQIVGL